MDPNLTTLVVSIAAVAVATLVAFKAKRRLALSRAKHPSLAGHSKMSRALARLIPFYDYEETGFFCSDGVCGETS
jgi:glutamate-1-semialdehyde 2,1-aminomutase